MMRAKSIFLCLFTLLLAGAAQAETCSENKSAGEQAVCPGPACRGVTIDGHHFGTLDKLAELSASAAYNTDVEVFQTEIVNEKVQEMATRPMVEFSADVEASGSLPTIELNPKKKFQTMYGFGAALTEACVMHLNRLPKKMREEFLQKAFGPNGANFNLIRLPMGATDFADPVKGNYTYNDTKGNKPDPQFKNFDMSRDEKSFEIIREVQKINPNLKVMVTPWSAPAWMKTTGKINGGFLEPKYRQTYANYFAKVIKEYKKRGIPVHSLTIQNEPAFEIYGVPSMKIEPKDQGLFIRDFLGPTLEKNNLDMRIFGHDHNWSQSERDADPIGHVKGVKKYLKGMAYHCYGGTKWGMWDTVNNHPDLELFQTECSGSNEGYPHASDFHWWLDTQSIGAINMGTTGSIAWNLCLDDKNGPVNWGKGYSGCTNCRGLAEINFAGADPKVIYNPEFHALAQTSRFIVPGTKRIEVAGKTDEIIQSTAFERPDGSLVLVVENLKNEPTKFRALMPDCRSMVYELPAQGASTFLWNKPLAAVAAKPVKKIQVKEEKPMLPATPSLEDEMVPFVPVE